MQLHIFHRYKTVKKEKHWYYQQCKCGKRRILTWSHLELIKANWIDSYWVRGLKNK